MRIEEGSTALSEQDIAHFEREIGRSIPTDYRIFLLQYNGGRPTPCAFKLASRDGMGVGIDWFLSISGESHNDLLNYLNTYTNRVPDDLFPIAYDPGGNLICIRETDGHIFYWDHDEEAEEGEPPTYENLYFVAESLSQLFASLSGEW